MAACFQKLIYFYKIELSKILNSLTGSKARENEDVLVTIKKEEVDQLNYSQNSRSVEQAMQTIHKFLSIGTIDLSGSSKDSSSDLIKRIQKMRKVGWFRKL